MKKVLGDLAKYLKVKGLRGLARHLEVPESRIYSWTKKGKIANTGLIVSKHPEINVEWLKTGKGPMLAVKASAAKSEKTTAVTESAVTPCAAATPITDALPEVVTKAIAVLASNSEYASILETTIEAFHRAVQKDTNLNTITQEITQLHCEIRELRQLLTSKNGSIYENKSRDTEN
jgi:hypothetical protein